MVSARETYAHKSAENNELTTNQHNIANLDYDTDKIKVNGSYSKENHEADASTSVDFNSSPNDGQVNEGTGNEQVENSESSSVKSPFVGSPPLTKGYGLRKWRRIKREIVKDASANADSSKVLKRGLSVSGNQIKPANLLSAEIKQNSEGSVESTGALTNGVIVDGLVASGANLEGSFAVGPAYAAAEDSENSEDQSSKSSTAASAPRLRYYLPTVLGHVREKNRVKNFSGKNVGSSTQRLQQGKGRVETSKKPRGERVKIEKENSRSSMESDSRSSNFVFMQGTCSVTTNGNTRERSMYYDGEKSDGGLAVEQQFGEGQENVGEDEDGFQDNLGADASWEDKEEKSDNHRPSIDQDPLIESILTLQSVQEVLESEVKKFGEIGITASSSFVDHESSSCDAGNIRLSDSFESQVLSLRENVRCLESGLEEAKVMLELKDSKVAELQSSGKSAKNFELQQEKCRVIESELDGIFKQKIEAEVEYLTLTKTIEKFRLFGEKAQIEEAERKATEEAEEVQGDISRTKEALKLQRRVCEVSSCLLMQLVLLLLIFWLLVSRLSTQSGVVVPT